MARILNQAAGKIVKKYNDLTQEFLLGPLINYGELGYY